MTAITFVVGIVLVTIGVLCAVYGVLLCHTTKGEYFNDEELRVMLAREAAEERARQEEEAKLEEQLQEEVDEEGRAKVRGILVAS